MCNYANTRFTCGDNINTPLEFCPIAADFPGRCVEYKIAQAQFYPDVCPGCKVPEFQNIIAEFQAVIAAQNQKIADLQESLSHVHQTHEIAKAKARAWAKTEVAKQGIKEFDSKHPSRKHRGSTVSASSQYARFPSQDLTVHGESTPEKETFRAEELEFLTQDPQASAFMNASSSSGDVDNGSKPGDAKRAMERSQRGESV